MQQFRWTRCKGIAPCRISGPKLSQNLAGLYLLSQRVPLQPRVRYRVEFDFHVQQPTDVGISVCEVHLLYDRRCQSAEFRLHPGAQPWQHRSLVLRGPSLSAGAAYAPRRAAFSIAVLNAGGVAEFDNLRLRGPDGTDLLRNGDFERDLAHWLPVAQYYFLPWHIDNLYLELLIEHGLAGLLAFALLSGLCVLEPPLPAKSAGRDGALPRRVVAGSASGRLRQQCARRAANLVRPSAADRGRALG